MLSLASVAGEIGRALSIAFGMLWGILWALILGFALSAMVQSVVSKRTMTRLLSDAKPRSLAAGFVVELLFGALGITPTARAARVVEADVARNCTTVLNIIFPGLAALLLWRFFRTGANRCCAR